MLAPRAEDKQIFNYPYIFMNFSGLEVIFKKLLKRYWFFLDFLSKRIKVAAIKALSKFVSENAHCSLKNHHYRCKKTAHIAHHSQDVIRLSLIC